MGLVSISEIQEITDDIFADRYVVVAHTDDLTVKLFFSKKDSGDALKDLLTENNVTEFTARALVQHAGLKVTKEYTDDPGSLATMLPGVQNLQVKHPISGEMGLLFNVIVSLNDTHHWKREAIADWIENTVETKDITFKTPEVMNEAVSLSEFTKVVTIQRIL